ncbi:MAG: hypothetical protein Kow00122_12080 [Thermoleophilia bacterium]
MDEVVTGAGPLLMLIGPVDSGKSTLALRLAEAKRRHFPAARIALVCTDPGQSHPGPPTTVGWTLYPQGRPGSPTPDWDSLEPAGLGFAGSTSPYGRPFDMLAAAVECVQQALQAADCVIVDTSGLAAGPAGLALKRAKLSLLRPDAVVLLEPHPGALALVAGWAKLTGGARVWIGSPPPQTVRRTPSERRQYRRERFRRYFAHAEVRPVPAGALGTADLLQLPTGGLFAGLDQGGKTLGVARLSDPVRLWAESPWPLELARAFVAGALYLDDEFGEHRLPRASRRGRASR